jgi:hypothetical protein
MTSRVRRTLRASVALGIVFVVLGGVASAQESKTVALAKELTQLLDQAKLDSIAAKDPAAPDSFVAALYFPGSQLLVVGAKYQVPALLTEKLLKKEYRDVYTDLNSAHVQGTKCFVMDIGADGLKAKKDDSRYDTCDIADKSYSFDGEWKKQKFANEEAYGKTYADAEARYAKMLSLLIDQLKK